MNTVKNRFLYFFNHSTVLLLRLFIGGLFIYASIHKLADPVSFSRIIYGYKILPPWAINISAIVLPGVEMVSGIFLILGLFNRGAALTIAITLLIFIVAIGFNLARGLEFDCGCFSFAHSKKGAATDILFRDMIFLVMTLRILSSRGYPSSLDWLLGLERK